MKPNVTKTVDDELTYIMNHCQNIFLKYSTAQRAHVAEGHVQFYRDAN